MRALQLVALLVAGALAADAASWKSRWADRVQPTNTPSRIFDPARSNNRLERGADDSLFKELGAMNAANINDYIDKELPNIAQFLLDSGMDPVALPDDVQSFSAEDPLGITWHGEVGLFEGSLWGLSQVVRAGDAFLDYSERIFKVNLTLGFENVGLSYGFECQLMDIGPKGTLYGTVHELEVFAEFSLDLTNVDSPVVTLNQLYFSNDGTLEITIEGIGLDLLDNVIADIVASLFDGVILDAIEDKARDVVQNALDGLNSQKVYPTISRMLISQGLHH